MTENGSVLPMIDTAASARLLPSDLKRVCTNADVTKLEIVAERFN